MDCLKGKDHEGSDDWVRKPGTSRRIDDEMYLLFFTLNCVESSS